MSANLTIEPKIGIEVLDRDGDRWKRTGGGWTCLTTDAIDVDWDELRKNFDPIQFANPGALGTFEEAREFDVRRTALLAAAAIVGGSPDGYEPGHEARDVTGLARKFEPYLRGEVK